MKGIGGGPGVVEGTGGVGGRCRGSVVEGVHAVDLQRGVDNTEITTMNRPRDVVFDWFFDPIMIIKEQIKVENFSEAEENYLCKLVLLIGDSKRLKSLNAGMNFENEQRRAEIDAFARRGSRGEIQWKSISEWFKVDWEVEKRTQAIV
ncbi:putative membrane protein [Acorus calamus]|uniref:Membrane protein n=1 Tax=Acorus calamus TaxID=4465 RepID=A0AAV9CPJ3_ACOCL|nr:putative membrane protein [Acorus calamus]